MSAEGLSLGLMALLGFAPFIAIGLGVWYLVRKFGPSAVINYTKLHWKGLLIAFILLIVLIVILIVIFKWEKLLAIFIFYINKMSKILEHIPNKIIVI